MLGTEQPAHDRRGAAAGVRALDRRGLAHRRGARLAVAGRRRTDRRVGGVGYMMVKGQSNISTPTVMAGMIAIGWSAC